MQIFSFVCVLLALIVLIITRKCFYVTRRFLKNSSYTHNIVYQNGVIVKIETSLPSVTLRVLILKEKLRLWVNPPNINTKSTNTLIYLSLKTGYSDRKQAYYLVLGERRSNCNMKSIFLLLLPGKNILMVCLDLPGESCYGIYAQNNLTLACHL